MLVDEVLGKAWRSMVVRARRARKARKELGGIIEKTSVGFVMAMAGSERQNAAGSPLPENRWLDPAVSSVRRFFPEARIDLYTDGRVPESRLAGADSIQAVNVPMSVRNRRYGWRATDWLRAYGLLQCRAAVGIYLDTDMRIVSDHFATIVPLTLRFGVCVPINPRLLVSVDTVAGADGDQAGVADPTLGQGTAVNVSPFSLNCTDARAKRLVEAYMQELVEADARGIGVRAPYCLWRAAWRTGIHPYVLAPQWCVSAGQEGIGGEIVLHEGHESVRKYYADF